MLARKLVVVSLASVLMGCSGQSKNAATPAPEILEGELRLAGSEPMTMVMLRPIAGGQEIRLNGPSMGELRRLSGLVVSVSGSMGQSAMQGFDVASYEIMSVQGRRPSVGTLAARDGGLWLDGDATSVRLTSVPTDLRSQVGAKVWVLGTMVDGSLRLETYGVIREP